MTDDDMSLDDKLRILIAKATAKGIKVNTTEFLLDIGSVSFIGLHGVSSFPMTAMDAVKLLGFHFRETV